MEKSAKLVRIPYADRSGTGLEEWEAMDPADLESGTPVQRGWLVDENDTGYLAGIWDCTAFDAKPGPYGEDEFMVLLEGSVTMVMPDGTAVTVNAGEAFVLPKGLHCQWKQPGYVRKIFMIVDDPVPPAPDNPSLHRVTVPRLDRSADGPVETAETWFTNASGRMSVSVRSSAGAITDPATSTAHEIVHVLAGEIALTVDGATERFGAGETAYIRAGTAVARTIAPGTRWLDSIYTPG